MLIVRKANTVKGRAVVTPLTNKWEAAPSILPPRFNSTSGVSQTPIVRSEFSSTSKPKIKGRSSYIG